uniref:DUF834 domain-containing protein n=1 Tax=Oryza glumipatula TaxID=40148 RepID=A0A0D9YA20_9ORYZ
MGSSRMARTSWESSTLTAVRFAAVGEDLGDVAAVLLPSAGKVPRQRRDVDIVHGGEAAEEERRRVDARGEAAEERHGRSRAEDGELDVPAAESGLGEDAADDGVIEDGEDKLGELDLDGGGSLGGGSLVVEVEGAWVVVLVGLGVLDGGHEGVGDGGFIGVEAKEEERRDGGEPVEGDGEAEVEGLELDAWGVGSAVSAGEGVAEEGRCGWGEEGGDEVEGGGLGVGAVAGGGDNGVVGGDGGRREALPRCSHRSGHR